MSYAPRPSVAVIFFTTTSTEPLAPRARFNGVGSISTVVLVWASTVIGVAKTVAARSKVRRIIPGIVVTKFRTLIVPPRILGNRRRAYRGMPSRFR